MILEAVTLAFWARMNRPGLILTLLSEGYRPTWPPAELALVQGHCADGAVRDDCPRHKVLTTLRPLSETIQQVFKSSFEDVFLRVQRWLEFSPCS